MTDNLHIYVECHPNEEIRTLHLSRPTFFKPFSKYDNDGLPKKIEKLNRKFARAIEIGEGSASIGGAVSLKEVRIERNRAFSWDETIARAVSILEGYFGTTASVTIMERNPEWDKPRDERDDWGY